MPRPVVRPDRCVFRRTLLTFLVAAIGTPAYAQTRGPQSTSPSGKTERATTPVPRTARLPFWPTQFVALPKEAMLLVVGEHDVAALTLPALVPRWNTPISTQPNGGVHRPPPVALHDGRLYFYERMSQDSTRFDLIALDVATGKESWRLPALGLPARGALKTGWSFATDDWSIIKGLGRGAIIGRTRDLPSVQRDRTLSDSLRDGLGASWTDWMRDAIERGAKENGTGGLESEDRIVRVDGKKLTEEWTAERLFAQHAPGDTVTIDVLRKANAYQLLRFTVRAEPAALGRVFPPVIVDSVVYMALDDRVVGAHIRTGAIQFSYTSPVAVADIGVDANRLFVLGAKCRLTALDRTTGTVQWNVIRSTRECPESTPYAALSLTDSLVVVTGGALGAAAPLSATAGTSEWLAYSRKGPDGVRTFDKRDGSARWSLPTLNEKTTAAVARNGLVVARNLDSGIHALRESDGQSLWNFSMTKNGLYSADPIIRESELLVHVSGAFYSVSLDSGRANWRREPTAWERVLPTFVAGSVITAPCGERSPECDLISTPERTFVAAGKKELIAASKPAPVAKPPKPLKPGEGPPPLRIRAECAQEADADGANDIFMAYGLTDENGDKLMKMWLDSVGNLKKLLYAKCLNTRWNFKKK